ncbi:phosphomannomutase/phosphoglucomutase [Patescibacteria group bacterium]
MNKKVFKSYDIRGIYPDDLTEDVAYLVGQAFPHLTKSKKVVVGRDMRIGSPELSQKLIEGLVSQGIDVEDIGLVSIDALYFSVGKFEYDGGIMVTASHNPKEYNGFKMVYKIPDGIEWIRGVELYEFIEKNTFADKPKKGVVTERDLMPEFIDHLMSFIDIHKIKPFTIVVDAGNGMAGKVMPELFKKLPCKLIPLNFELDGNFPAHPSNPLLPESQAEIKKRVVAEKADFGIILDGDTDRLFFVTEKGEFVSADTTLLILAKYFIAHNPNAGIAYNVICSKAVRERVKEWGGRPLRSKVGFVFLARAMKKEKGIMSGELSAHYAFRDNYYADSGFIAFLILLMLISEDDKPLSKIIEGINPYAKAPEVNIKVKDIQAIIQKVKEKFSDGEQDELDGITVEYKDWWFNVRPSNTEPLLRITVEGDTEEILKEKQQEVVEFIKQHAD